MGGAIGAPPTIHTAPSGDEIWAGGTKWVARHTAQGVAQFRTTHSSPHWGSLHEVLIMQTITCVVGDALQVSEYIVKHIENTSDLDPAVLCLGKLSERVCQDLLTGSGLTMPIHLHYKTQCQRKHPGLRPGDTGE